MTAPLLEINGLTVDFHTPGGWLRAVSGVDFEVHRGETLGLVGESGCGKTVTALSILRLLPPHLTQVSGGVRFAGEDLLELDDERLRDLRGNHISMIFQEPMTALNPVLTIGDQVAEVVRQHRQVSRQEAEEAAVQALTRVGLPDAAGRLHQYPHQLSGGLRQRVLIAMALALTPQLLIADEPTTALDVTIQAQILALLARLKAEMDLAVLFITHNLGIVAQTTDRVAVMYAGLIVEASPTAHLFQSPAHPYTRGLLQAVPRLDFEHQPGAVLAAIPGHVPGLWEHTPGCLFADRCPKRHDRCEQPPPWAEVGRAHQARCWLYG